MVKDHDKVRSDVILTDIETRAISYAIENFLVTMTPIMQKVLGPTADALKALACQLDDGAKLVVRKD